MSDNKENFSIDFEKTAFDLNGEISSLHGKQPYTQEIARASEQVEVLDRYDDFADLKISPKEYEQAGGVEYGIPRSKQHGGGDVIYQSQKEAAHRFLRDLRGFGLLADVVGSGKTFEAGVILSELAVRNKVKSLLIVTPNQVFDSWVDVLENKFGMGKGVLYQVRNPKNEYDDDDDESAVALPMVEDVIEKVGVTNEDGFVRPLRPIIVDVEVFANWYFVDNLLFDVIVVDEAHHLCEEGAQYSQAMKLLSDMMVVKKKAASTYCLLLTATPHSGNLAQMFRLWYFIRCRGGNPADFVESKQERHSQMYLEEERYYRENICQNASNISEFIRHVKVNEMETDRILSGQFYAYLDSVGRRAEYAAMSDFEKAGVVDKFLHDNPKIREEVLTRVADAYHNTVLRPIMIRQANKHLTSKKTVRNLFFYPMKNLRTRVDARGPFNEPISVDMSGKGDFMPTVIADGEEIGIAKYTKEARGNKGFSQAFGDIMTSALGALNEENSEIFTKSGSLAYYSYSFQSMDEDVAKHSAVIPVEFSRDKLGYKYEYTKKILAKYPDKRVLVFFDYDVNEKESVVNDFVEALKRDGFGDRVIVGAKVGKHRTIKKFEEKKDAILVVKDAGFTEGANLQMSNVIINYQVTPDPLAMDQRIGRIFRLGQESDVEIYSLADMNKLEGYCLAYFATIGLLSSNSGDATILAGSNSDMMVAVRCPTCHRVKLLPSNEYIAEVEKLKKEGKSSVLVCRQEGICRTGEGGGQVMNQISVYDFKCDRCGLVLGRSVEDEGYLCIGSRDGIRGKLCNSGEHKDRRIYCRKICAIAHCKKFAKGGELFGKCRALEMYKTNPSVGDSVLENLCAECDNHDCDDECRITGVGPEQIEGCHNCKNYATCSPRPHMLDFGDDDSKEWIADCPDCAEKHKDGKLKPIVARTFAAFIRGCWDFAHDGGESFCENLMRETENVNEIRRILERDDERA